MDITASANLGRDAWMVFGFPSTNGKITSKYAVACRMRKGHVK